MSTSIPFCDVDGTELHEGDIVAVVNENLPDYGKLAQINVIVDDPANPRAFVCLGLYRNLSYKTPLGTAKALRKYFMTPTDIRKNRIQDPHRVLKQEFDL